MRHFPYFEVNLRQGTCKLVSSESKSCQPVVVTSNVCIVQSSLSSSGAGGTANNHKRSSHWLSR